MADSGVLGLRVDRVDYDAAIARILAATEAGLPLRVAAANVHVVMEAHDDPTLAALLAGFELVVPDGQPVRWMLNALGPPRLPDRVYGPELMRRLCAAAEARAIPIALYGATEAILADLGASLERAHPALRVACAIAPPFGDGLWRAAPTDATRLAESGARLCFVGLGCPRQERWVGLYAERAGMPCVAVGAAFDLLAGRKPEAPAWMQARGLEWLHRLVDEPERTARRYLVHNPRFVALAARSLAVARWARRG